MGVMERQEGEAGVMERQEIKIILCYLPNSDLAWDIWDPKKKDGEGGEEVFLIYYSFFL